MPVKNLLIISFVPLIFASAPAQQFQARLVTSGYVWERQDSVNQSSTHFYGYQTIQASVAGENLALYTYWQGFNDFAGPLKNNPEYRVFNLYLKARNLFDILDVSAGRQAIFAGVGNGSIDGGSATLKLFDSQIRLTGYYGALPPPGQKAELIGDQKNNFMGGEQLVVVPDDNIQISVSHMRRNIKPESYTAYRRDSLFNPYLAEIKPSATQEEYISGDVNLEYEDLLSLFGRYDYDANLEKSSRYQFFTRLKLMEDFGLTAEYLQRDPRLSFNSIFSVFTFSTLKEYDLGAELMLDDHWQAFARYGSVAYGEGDNSNRITVGANGPNVSASISRNTGNGNDLSAAALNLGCPISGNELTTTLMLSYAQYKLSETAPRDGAFSMAFGVVYRPIPLLALDTQVQWIQNKIYKNDTRLFIRASYYLSQRLDIF